MPSFMAPIRLAPFQVVNVPSPNTASNQHPFFQPQTSTTPAPSSSSNPQPSTSPQNRE
ncbi:hypothetical protein K491DRAFT_691342 [Lophiostoma macrostomum CBS 122681]|uniref:Uncharacterized protein n=1 Tax=Lophiostoma macrostomum CBS 122681 TaxID=1314788 RepID=A0A6A6TAY1_9PLEO|nr:hypothetical protein K491DRAFT_691342 [Lophiostoma macrostomum CBS 122681]